MRRDERMIREKTEDEIRWGVGGVVRLYGRKRVGRMLDMIRSRWG